MGCLFDARQYVADVSGAGNNWAHGHHSYGPIYEEEIAEKLRTEFERCDSLHGVIMLHSLGGGTGSGLGSYVMEMIKVRGDSVVDKQMF